MKPDRFEAFLEAYLECMVWAAPDPEDDGVPLDQNYSVKDIEPESLKAIRAECKAFFDTHWDDISDDITRAGHDFYLTRNEHGAGFWDGDWPEAIGERLTEASHAFGFSVLIPGDGMLYVH